MKTDFSENFKKQPFSKIFEYKIIGKSPNRYLDYL